MKLNELLDSALLAQRIEEKYVKVQHHPTKPFKILNYTDNTTYDRVWDDVTTVCRGLIVDTRTDEIVARPMAKFFNADEPNVAQILGDEPVIVTDKADGSLAILFWADDQWEIATRGSFASEQAQHATKLWQLKYGDIRPQSGMTFLFEIVYPENRYVVDYRGMDDLILLGAVDIESGHSADPARTCAALGWSGPVVEEFTYSTLTEALSAPPRDNAEGLVVWAPNSGARVKIKYLEYKRLFRLLTGLTPRRLWEYLAVKAVAPTATIGKNETSVVDYMVRRLRMAPERVQEIVDSPDDWQIALVERVPEEFEQWVRERVHTINEGVHWDRELVLSAFENVRDRFDAPPTAGKERGEFVKIVRGDYPDCWQLLMALLDDMPIEASLWERHRPEAERAFAQQGEDVA